MSLPASPATPAAHGHGDAHGHGHAHGHPHGHTHGQAHGDGGDHGHQPTGAAPQPGGLPSLLMAGVGARLLGVAGLLAVLWLAVAWALGEPA